MVLPIKDVELLPVDRIQFSEMSTGCFDSCDSVEVVIRPSCLNGN